MLIDISSKGINIKKIDQEIIFQNNTDSDKQLLNSLKDKPELNQNIKVIYIYSLFDDEINYPKKIGNIIYIGESCKKTEPTGKRFSEHISTTRDKGGDFNSNYTLSYYYWNNKKLKLDIYLLDEKDDRKEIEMNLLKYHVQKYGSLPIGQGTTGKNYTVSHIKDFKIKDNLEKLI
jgi:hypothetical protein